MHNKWYITKTLLDCGSGPDTNSRTLYFGDVAVARFNSDRRDWPITDNIALNELCKYLNGILEGGMGEDTTEELSARMDVERKQILGWLIGYDQRRMEAERNQRRMEVGRKVERLECRVTELERILSGLREVHYMPADGGRMQPVYRGGPVERVDTAPVAEESA